MNKIIAFVALFCVVAFAQPKPKIAFAQPQSKPKVAVIIDGDKLAGNANSQFSRQIVSLLGDKYDAEDVTTAALKSLRGERRYQQTGELDDSAIKRLGRQFKAEFLCVISIDKSSREYLFEAQLLGVESSFTSTGSDNSTVARFNANATAKELVNQLTSERMSRNSSSYTSNSFKDSRDGKTYRTVKIGRQTWMAENLNFENKNSKCYENSNSSCRMYGRLYDERGAKDACPRGWHLPSSNEWNDLAKTVGGERIAGKKLKARRGWDDGGNGTDDYDFTALPGGYFGSGSDSRNRRDRGDFDDSGEAGYFWVSNGENIGFSNKGVNHRNKRENGDMMYTYDNKDWYKGGNNMYSVRCLKD